MGKKNQPTVRPSASAGENDPGGAFPPTQTILLAAAAAGRWEEFLAAYLRPCWENVAAACRAKGFQLHDADDLFQELVIRLMRPGKFAAVTKRRAADVELAAFTGNLPARYLRYRKLPLESARFRTYLKNVIANLLLEAWRRRKKFRRQVPLVEEPQWSEWLERSIDVSIERHCLRDALQKAVDDLFREVAAASTQGRQRYFAYLYYGYVRQLSHGVIALKFDIDRTTVSEGYGEARKRLIELMQQRLGTDAEEELRDWLNANGPIVAQTFAAYRDAIERAISPAAPRVLAQKDRTPKTLRPAKRNRL